MKKAFKMSQQVLDEYFSSTHFNFREGTHTKSLEYLKKVIPLVYLRNRPLISLDIEAWERDTSIITEIGFSIYQPNPQELFPNIKAHHLIIKEHFNKINSRYVGDNKKNFIGKQSHIIPKQSATDITKKIIETYIVEGNAILVGHSINGDIKWLKSLGITFPENMITIDTLDIHQLSSRVGGKLKLLCKNLDIYSTYMHNAGNDAYFTLLAAIKLCDPTVRLEKKLDIYNDADLTLGQKITGKRLSDEAIITAPDPNSIIDSIINDGVEETLEEGLTKNPTGKTNFDKDIITSSSTTNKLNAVENSNLRKDFKTSDRSSSSNYQRNYESSNSGKFSKTSRQNYPDSKYNRSDNAKYGDRNVSKTWTARTRTFVPSKKEYSSEDPREVR